MDSTENAIEQYNQEKILEIRLANLKKQVCWSLTTLMIVNPTDKTIKNEDLLTFDSVSFYAYFKQKELIEKLNTDVQILLLGKYYLGFSRMRLSEEAMIPSFTTCQKKISDAVRYLRTLS